MRSIEQHISEFDARGVRLVAISADEPEVLREHRTRLGYTFPLLSDTKADVIGRYDLTHVGAGPGGSNIARPAEFYVDRNGIVRWVNLTGSIAVRARPEQILRGIDGARPKP